MGGNAAGKRKLLEEFLNSFGVLSDICVDFRIRAFKIGIGDQSRTSMPRSGDIENIQVTQFDNAVQVRVQKIQAGSRSPVSQKTGLYMVGCERLYQESVSQKINLSDREIVRRTPVGMNRFSLGICQGRRIAQSVLGDMWQEFCPPSHCFQLVGIYAIVLPKRLP